MTLKFLISTSKRITCFSLCTFVTFPFGSQLCNLIIQKPPFFWMKVLVAQLCSTLCKTLECSPPGFPPPPTGFPSQYWSGLPFPTPGGIPDPGIKSMSLASPALEGRFFTVEWPGKRAPNSCVRGFMDTQKYAWLTPSCLNYFKWNTKHEWARTLGPSIPGIRHEKQKNHPAQWRPD